MSLNFSSHLSPQWIKSFKKDGFVHLPQVFHPQEIDTLVTAIDMTLKDPHYQDDLLTLNASKHIHKILYPLNKHPLFLRYIAHPYLMELILPLIENPTQIVLTWEDILIKIPYHGIPVGPHQDLALQSTQHDIFSLGIYLHDSTDNPVYYLPGSFNYGALTRQELQRIVEAERSHFVPVIAKAGDVVIHSVKTIHYSNTNASANPRYTWYLEYRTLDQLRQDSPWDETWIQQRRAIFVAALKGYCPDQFAALVPDYPALTPYLEPLNLRVPHTNDKVQYDMQSPYNHFA